MPLASWFRVTHFEQIQELLENLYNEGTSR